MSELAATQIPKPSDEQAFERCSVTLWRCILKDETTHAHGRRGQRQHGVDIVGCRNKVPDQIVGIQCKVKGDGKMLLEKEVRDEVAKALTFTPPLSEYFIVTTAPDDANLQRLAHELSIAESASRGKNISIRVLGWGSLQQDIRAYPEALNAFDPSHTPFGQRLERKLDGLSNDVIEAIHEGFRTIQPLDPAGGDTAVQSVIENQIHDYVELISTDPKTALELLQSLRARLDPGSADRIRLRVDTNISVCHLALGRDEIAADGLIAAYDIAPRDPKAVANKALGLLLKEDWPSLKAFAEAKLVEFPDNADLAAHYIHSLVTDEAVQNPLINVPEAVRGTPQVAKAHVEWLMTRGRSGAWMEAAVEAHKAHSDSHELQLIYASALLDRISDGNPVMYGQILRGDQRADVEQAISIYEARWAEIRDGVRRMTEPQFIPLNLMVAYRLLQEGGRAVEIGRQALERFPGNEEVKKYLSAALAEQGETDRAEELILDLDPSPDTLMAGFELVLAKNDWSAVSDFVAKHLGKYSGAQQDFLRAAGLRADIEFSTVEEGRRSILEAAQNRFQGNLRALILLSQGARIYAYDDLANSYFAEVFSAFECGDKGLASRLFVANEAMARGESGKAADVLIDHLILDRDSPELRLLAQALVCDYPIRRRAVEFFKNLADNVRSLPVFRQLEGILHINRGAPGDAIAPFQAAFDELPGIDTLMHLITAFLRVGDRDAVEKLLQSKDFDALHGPPLDRINFCHVLLDFGQAERALELGYQALTEGLDDVEVVTKFLGLVLVPSPNRPDSFNGVVTTGVWFRLTPSLGDACEGLMGEAEDRPWGPKIDPSNSFFAKASGRKSGDTFEHTNAATGGTEIWTVAEVKPRWLQAFHYLSMSFSQRFPTSRQFASVALPKNDIGPALEQVRRHSEAMRSQADLYLARNIPISFIAGYEPGGSIAFADYLNSIGEEVRVCFGTVEERTEALALIENNRQSGAVLDAFTAWHAAGLGVFSVLEERLGPLVIPANELHRLKEMATEHARGVDQETTSLSYRNGQYIGHVTTPDERAERLALIEFHLGSIEETCKMEPVVIPDNLPEAGEKLIHHPAGAAVTPAVMAGQDRLLLSEDIVMRQMTSKVYGTRGVWLQAVLLSALQARTMTLNAYSEALVYLAAHRHGHVAVNLGSLLSTFDDDTDVELGKLRCLCAYLGAKNAESISNIRLAADFLNAIWANTVPNEAKVHKATDLVLHALLLQNRGDEWAEWVASLFLALADTPGIFLLGWCQQQSLPTTEIESVLQRQGPIQQKENEPKEPTS